MVDAEELIVQGSTAIRDLVEQAQGRISIMAGGGVRAKTAELLVSMTGVSSLHASTSGWALALHCLAFRSRGLSFRAWKDDQPRKVQATYRARCAQVVENSYSSRVSGEF